MGNILDKVVKDFKNLIFLGNFDAETEEKYMSKFMIRCNLKNLIKHKTCFENPENPPCIDLVLKNFPRSFQRSNGFETGLSDFQKTYSYSP